MTQIFRDRLTVALALVLPLILLVMYGKAVSVRGSVILLYSAGGLCVLAGIGLGTFLATFSRSLQQAQLPGFFVNPPIAMIFGATTPVEAMPY